MWVLQYYSVHAFDMSTIIIFVYLGLQVKWNQFSSNNSHHTSCIHKGSHAGKWTDLMTPKQILSVHWDTTEQTTLEHHWSHKYTGMPLEPHWLMLEPVVFQWRSSVNSHNWNTLEDHWSHKYTGMPLEPHWLMLAPSGVPVAIQC